MGVGRILESVRPSLEIKEIRIIRIYLRIEDDFTQVVLEIFDRGKQIGLLVTTLEELGLPGSKDESLGDFFGSELESGPSTRFRVPDYIVTGLKYLLVDGVQDRTPIWLDLVLPAGFLPAIPWEALLQPSLSAPLLRVPHQFIKPVMPRESLDVILCLGTLPDLPLQQVASKLLQGSPTFAKRDIRLYIFADEKAQPALQRTKVIIESPLLHFFIFNPKDAPDYRTALAGCPPNLQNPWLVWIRSALAGRSTDLAYFKLDGDLSAVTGSLVFPASPLPRVDPRLNQFVGAEELSAFLNETGAWSTAFSLPPDACGAAGVRMFYDHLARLRPGPSLVFDPADSELQSLQAAFEFLFGTRDGAPPASPYLSLSCHPSGTERSAVADVLTYLPKAVRAGTAAYVAKSPRTSRLLAQLLTYAPAVRRAVDILETHDSIGQLLDTYTVASRAASLLMQKQNTPLWLAAAQRTLEESLSRVCSGPPGANEARAGSEEALKIVADIASRVAKSGGGEV